MLKTISNIIYLSLITFFLIFFSIIFIFFFFGRDLPNLDKLSYYKPRLVSKIYTAEGNFLEDYSNENRVFTQYDEIPIDLIECYGEKAVKQVLECKLAFDPNNILNTGNIIRIKD